MIKIKKCLVKKVTTTLSKDGDIIARVILDYNLSRQGDLTQIADLVALQNQNVELRLKPERMDLEFPGKEEAA